MSCHICRCGDNGFCRCSCHKPMEGESEAGWKNAALVVGEHMGDAGPDGYYDFTAEDWRDWAIRWLTRPSPAANIIEDRSHEIAFTDDDDDAPAVNTEGLRTALTVLSKAAKRFQLETDEKKRDGRIWDKLYEAIEKADAALRAKEGEK